MLTSNWPKGFTPNKTQYVPDYSLQNIRASNDVELHHSISWGNCSNNQETKNNPFNLKN